MPSATNPYKKVINHSVIYSAANILRKIVGFLMLPLYTHYLTPADYGAVELLMAAITIVEVFLAMRMGQAIFRYYYLAKDPDEKKAVMSTAFLMTLCTGIIASIFLAMNSGTATLIILGDTHYADLLSIFAIVLLTQALEEYGLIYVRVHQRALLFLALSVSKLIISLSLNIYFIVFMKLSVAGIVYSSCISTGLMAIFATIYTFYYSGITFSKSLLKSLVIFSYPLWIGAFAAFYSGASAKYFLRIFSGLGDVGLYALAGKFASLIFVFVWNPFSTTWASLRYEIYEMQEPNLVFKNIFIILTLILSFAGLGISLFSDTVIHLMADKAFWLAGGIVPILAMATIVQSLARFNNFGILLKGKTGILAVGTYLNAFMISIGFVILIPLVGLYGAAAATLLGGIFELSWIEWKSKKLYNMQLPWLRVAFMNMAWLACYSISLLLPTTLMFSVAGKILIIILFVYLLFVTPILEQKEKDQILNFAKSSIKKVVSYFNFSRV